MSNEITTTGPWPRFAGLETATVPAWMSQSVDEITAIHGEKIRMVFVDLWAHYYHDDNSNIDPRASGDISFVNYQDKVDQDELDHVPAMRRLERRAIEIWEHAPFDCDADGNTIGEFSYMFTRDGFEYEWNRYEFTFDPDYSATAKLVNGSWEYEERITLYDFTISETALAIGESAEILAQISAEDMGLKTMPEISTLTHEYNEENESITIIAKGGGLFEHFESEVV